MVTARHQAVPKGTAGPALSAARRLVKAGATLLREHERASFAFSIVSGWAFSYRLLQDGSRQVTSLHVPGDLVGFFDVVRKSANLTVEAITPLEVRAYPKAELDAALHNRPQFFRTLLGEAIRQEATLAERLIDVGRRSALARTAHLLLELGFRLRHVEPDAPRSYPCPVTQYVLADALGLTPIHLNRCLRQLRETGLLTFRNSIVTVQDLPGLTELAQFDCSYVDGLVGGDELSAFPKGGSFDRVSDAQARR